MQKQQSVCNFIHRMCNFVHIMSNNAENKCCNSKESFTYKRLTENRLTIPVHRLQKK